MSSSNEYLTDVDFKTVFDKYFEGLPLWEKTTALTNQNFRHITSDRFV